MGVTARELRCPTHATSLSSGSDFGAYSGIETARVPVGESQLTCDSGCQFPVRAGVPRFVGNSTYAAAFGLQWRQFRTTQLDSSTGFPISKSRLERCLGDSLESLNHKSVLEVGAGAGRFTEWLVDAAGELVAMDLSDAVDANLHNCAGRKPYLLVQADINTSPLPKRSFDVVICLGVVQCTPSPEKTILSLAEHVKPGGLLVLDNYAKRRFLGAAARYLTLGYPLRMVFSRLPPDKGLRATNALTAFCDPIRKRTCRRPLLDLFMSRLLPTACYYTRFPELPDHVVREWNELDTHDGLTDRYKHLRSPKEIRAALEDAGLNCEHCSLDGNGVEARATRPRIP
jgi:SAM-dependent methyltransferase